MASSSRSQRQLLVVVVVLLAWISIAAARPCKTLWVSSYSFSLRQQPSSAGVVTIFTEISHFRPLLTSDAAFFIDIDEQQQQFPQPQPQQQQQQQQQLPSFALPSLSSAVADLSSLRDRTKDILSVVVALLFGVGCGALTAATMYLAWSLFSSREDYYSDEEEAGAADLSPKKMGYVKIPAADSKQTAV